MPEWHQAKNEILLALYNYQLMSPRQLAILLGYEKSSIYRVGKHLLKEELIRSVVLPFLPGNSRAYALTRQGAKIAWQLSDDTPFFTGKLWDEAPTQLAHSYGANEFFIRLIERSLHRDNEGLAKWMGPREAAEMYAQFPQNTPNKKKLPLKPDGIGTYWFADGRRLKLHLEYDTGSESLYRLQDKLWNYARYMPNSWGDRITRIPIMVITRGARRARHIFHLWKSLKEGPLCCRSFPLTGKWRFFLAMGIGRVDNEWRMQPEAVTPFIVKGAAEVNIKRKTLWVPAPSSFTPRLSLTTSVVEKKIKVKPFIVIEESVMAPHPSVCSNGHHLWRHGGLIRERSDTIRIGRGRYRCPLCSLPMAACSPAAQQAFPPWHSSLEAYLRLVGTHGLPEEDRPERCPTGCPCKRIPHRHSHYWRSVVTSSLCQRICIFRFRCPGCGYVHSVIPAFLQPYQPVVLDLQEDLMDTIHQGSTLETVAEISEALPGGAIHERTLGRFIRGWNERLLQLESGLWTWLLERAPHLTLSRSASLWNRLRTAWQAVREQIPGFREIRFLQGLNRLCFSLTVMLHG